MNLKKKYIYIYIKKVCKEIKARFMIFNFIYIINNFAIFYIIFSFLSDFFTLFASSIIF